MVGVDLAGCVPNGVPGPIFTAFEIAVHRVHLHAEGIDAELEAAALVVEGVEEKTDGIVKEGHVPVGIVGADLAGVGIGGAEGEIEVVAVVGQKAGGGNCGGAVVGGEPLVGQRDLQRLSPGIFVEHAVDGDFLVGDGDRVAGRRELRVGRLRGQSVGWENTGQQPSAGGRPEEAAKSSAGQKQRCHSRSSNVRLDNAGRGGRFLTRLAERRWYNPAHG